MSNHRHSTKKRSKRSAGKLVVLNEEELIRQVELRPILYDRSLKAYRKSGLRIQYWREVGDAMGATVEECRRRWRSLRDAFTKHLKHQVNQTPITAGGYPKRKKWVFYDQMSFIAPFLDNTGCEIDETLLEDIADNSDETKTLILLPTDDGSDGEVSQHHDTDAQQQLNAVESALKSCDSLEHKFASVLPLDVGLDVQSSTPLSDMQSQQEQNSNASTSVGWTLATTSSTATQADIKTVETVAELDGDEKFLLSCAPVLRRISNRKNALARLKIQQILFEIEFGGD